MFVGVYNMKRYQLLHLWRAACYSLSHTLIQKICLHTHNLLLDVYFDSEIIYSMLDATLLSKSKSYWQILRWLWKSCLCSSISQTTIHLQSYLILEQWLFPSALLDWKKTLMQSFWVSLKMFITSEDLFPFFVQITNHFSERFKYDVCKL